MSSGFDTCWNGVDISGAGVGGLLLSVLSILFYAIATGTEHWAEADGGAGLKSVRMGLFRYCTNGICEEYVDDEFNGEPSNYNLVTRTEATAAFCIISIFLTVFAVVKIVFALGREGHGEIVYRAAILEFFSAFSGMVAMAIFADLFRELPARYDPGYSFGLATTAWILNLVAGLLSCVDSRNISYLSASSAAKTGGRGMI